jgi:hypothetical protein
MKPSEIKRFNKYYDRHVKLFKLQGKKRSLRGSPYFLSEACGMPVPEDMKNNYFRALLVKP